ncbi:protein KINESIN LIGHT CHAIN-RELATED 2-like [Silene latifolia]|uniref:protein KINESIN LIGHT CHAIN-RELATED 2-like n=1 Tax=Silene latifolia TaxID=37657 RepID=UPI003D76C849
MLMPEEAINRVIIHPSSSPSQFKIRNPKQNASPISPLSPKSSSCCSFDLAMIDGVDDSIDKLCQNICDMESSDGSASIHSFTTYGNESRIDSELRCLVGASVETKEDIKEVVVVEQKNKVRKSNKIGKIVKGISSNVTCMGYMPPVGKTNTSKSTTAKRRSISFDSREGVVEKGTNNPDLGPYLLKKAKDLLSSGLNENKALELILRAKKCFETCVYDKPNLDYVMCLHILASMYCSAGQYKEAIPVLERSIEVPNIELSQNHCLAKFVGCMKLGDIYAMLGQVEESILYYTTGLEIQKRALGAQDSRLGGTCRYVAEAYVQAFEFDEAEKLCEMALDIHKDNGSPFSIEEASDRRLMGLICDSKGNHEAALEHYKLASKALCSIGMDSEVAVLECSIGDAYLVLGRYDDAVFSFKKALSSFRSNKGKNHPAVASVFVRLAELYTKVGKFSESKSYSEKALQIYNKPPPPGVDVDDIANGLIELATIYETMNEMDEALKLLKKAQELYSERAGHKSVIAGVEAQIGVIYYMLGNYSECYTYLKSSVSKFEASGEKRSSLYAITLNQVGLACVQLNEISEAVELFEEARGILEKEYGLHHPDTLGVYSNLAAACDALGRWDQAIELLEYVVLMREEKLGTADPVANDEKCRLAELLTEVGKTRRRNSRSLETLLDKNFQTIKRNITRFIW